MREAVRTLLLGMGEDPDREGLRDTPKRVVKALKFLTSGYQQSLDELLNGAVFSEELDEMVLVRDIDLFSSCEHHILPIIRESPCRLYSQWQSHWPVKNCPHLRDVCSATPGARTVNRSDC